MVMTYLFAFGAILGAVDCIFHNRFGLGEQFEEGFRCLGATALSITGIICITPIFGNILRPFMVPAFHFVHIDPAMLGCILANNMGGYDLAMSLADSKNVGLFSGLIVSSMLGATIVYTLPIGLGLISEKAKEPFLRGIMIGLIPIPVGAAVGGLLIGLTWLQILIDSIPIILITVFLFIGLQFFPKKLMRAFKLLTEFLRVIAIGSLGIAAFSSLSGKSLIPDIGSLKSAMEIISEMGIMQLGCLPLTALMLRMLKKPLNIIGKKLGISGTAIGAIPVACVNVLSVFPIMKDMDDSGIVLVSAWSTSAIAVFTAHLAYTKAICDEMVGIVILSKLISAFLAVILAYKITKSPKRSF